MSPHRRATTILASVALVVPVAVTAVISSPAGAARRTPSSCAKTVAPGYAACMAIRRTDKQVPNAVAPHAVPVGYGPADIQSAYHLSPPSGHPVVAIIDAFDDPTAEADLAVYRTQYGLPACTTANGCFRKVNQNGQTAPLPGTDNEWITEITLDVDAVSAACPACHILLVETDDNQLDNLLTGVDLAVSRGAKFVSMSFGSPDDGFDYSFFDDHFDTPGVLFAAATGDYGYDAGPSYPSTSPQVLAIGGTSLYADASSSRGWDESAWSGAQSGCSPSEQMPDRQVGVVPCRTKGTADISAVADPDTGIAVYDTSAGSGWDLYGGTSLATPLIASMYAIAGTPGPHDDPSAYPYEHSAGLNDVTDGSNGSCSPAVFCTSGTGWDGPTGLGTPAGVSALTAPTGGQTSVSVSASVPGGRGFGLSTTFTATVSGGTGTPTGPVVFGVNGMPVATVALANGHATLTTAALPPGLDVVSARYAGSTAHPPASGHLDYTISCDRMLYGTVRGAVLARTGSTCVIDASVQGSVTVSPGASFAALDSTVGGGINAGLKPAAVEVCGTRTGGSVTVSGATTLAFLGDGDIGCTANTFAGALLMTHDHVGVAAVGNRSASLVAVDYGGTGPYPGMPAQVSR